MKKIIISSLALLLLIVNISIAQTNQNLIDFNKSRNKRTDIGLKVLGGWAVANVATSGYYYYNTTGSDKYFHQMNVYWNGFNIIIVAASLLPKQKNELDMNQSLRWQSNIESTYIANAALDLVYSSVGLYLTERAKNDLAQHDKFTGWGNSLILQGGFLFLLDTSMFIVHKRNGKKLYKMLDKVTIGASNYGFRIVAHI